MPVTQETIVLGPLNGPDGALLKQRRRTTSRGTTDRYTIDLTGDSMAIDLDAMALGAEVAEALRDELSEAIKQISAPASQATLERRHRYARDGSSPSYQRRYSGGRIGEKRPGSANSTAQFNDSGRLAEGLHLRQNRRENAFTINVPANRLTEQHFIYRLAELVPELRNPRLLMNSPEVRDAIHRARNEMVRRVTGISDLRRAKLTQARWRAAKAVVGLARALGGM